MRNNEIKNEIDEIKQKNLIYKANKYKYDFQQYETMRSLNESFYTVKINIDEVKINQSNLLKNSVKFTDKSRPRTVECKGKKRNTYESAHALYEGRELILNAFRSGIFPIKEIQGKGLKILTPKEMLQSLPIALAKVKSGNT